MSPPFCVHRHACTLDHNMPKKQQNSPFQPKKNFEWLLTIRDNMKIQRINSEIAVKESNGNVISSLRFFKSNSDLTDQVRELSAGYPYPVHVCWTRSESSPQSADRRTGQTVFEHACSTTSDCPRTGRGPSDGCEPTGKPVRYITILRTGFRQFVRRPVRACVHIWREILQCRRNHDRQTEHQVLRKLNWTPATSR